MKKTIRIKMSILLVAMAMLCINITPAAAAATATISASPGSGTKTVGTSFNVTIQVNGGGQNFTSFSANVSTSNLTIISLTKGSSVRQWTTEPSSSSLNFSGAVSGSTSSVTVYVLSVKGKAAGKASISISNGSVGSTDGYTVTNILSSSNGASYDIAAAPVASVPASTTPVVPPATVAPATAVPVSPVLPDTETDLEKSWTQYATDQTLSATAGPDATVAIDKNGNLTGAKLIGNATPGTLITAYVFSTKLVKSTTADANGLWSIVLSEALTSGSHTAYIVSTKDGVNTRIPNKLVFAVNAANKAVGGVVSTTTVIAPANKCLAWRGNFWLWGGIGLGLIVLILALYFLRKKYRRQEITISPVVENNFSISQTPREETAVPPVTGDNFPQNQPPTSFS